MSIPSQSNGYTYRPQLQNNQQKTRTNQQNPSFKGVCATIYKQDNRISELTMNIMPNITGLVTRVFNNDKITQLVHSACAEADKLTSDIQAGIKLLQPPKHKSIHTKFKEAREFHLVTPTEEKKPTEAVESNLIGIINKSAFLPEDKYAAREKIKTENMTVKDFNDDKKINAEMMKKYPEIYQNINPSTSRLLSLKPESECKSSDINDVLNNREFTHNITFSKY